MKLYKKLAAAGLVSVLAITQYISALASPITTTSVIGGEIESIQTANGARSTTFTVEVPFVQISIASSNVTGVVGASNKDYYLSMKQWMLYKVDPFPTEKTTDVKSGYSQNKTNVLRLTHTISHEKASKVTRAITKGYYSLERGEHGSVAGLNYKDL